MKTLVTGPQGSGKTTIAKALSKETDMCLVKTGDLVRERALVDDEVGLMFKNSLETGELSNDKMVAALLKDHLDLPQCFKGFIIDGYPRRLSQLNQFDPNFDLVFYLVVSDEVAIERMLKRGRVDDTPELIKERLRIFHDKTMDVINYYEKLGVLKRINGEQEVEAVVADIMKEIKNAS
jgi:adenylate kinase